VLPVIGFAAAAFCLCFAGAIVTAMQAEKAQPYELIIASEGNTGLSQGKIAEMTEIDDVLAVTPVYQVPVTIKTGAYAARLTLTGINAAYLTETYSQGGGFPESSVMPYMVLNEAAQKQFSEDQTNMDQISGDTAETDADENAPVQTDGKLPAIDWLNGNFALQSGEEAREIAAKVCGILAGEEGGHEQEPAAYISLKAAKDLLQKSGQSTNYAAIHVRVENIGRADSVSKALAALGLMVSNSTEELQAGWDADAQEMAYLIAIGGCCLVSAAALTAAGSRISLLRQAKQWEAVRWLGMRKKDLRRQFAIQSILLCCMGMAVGLIVAICLPSFLSMETRETNFMLAIPFAAALGSALLCLIASLIPFWERVTIIEK